MQDLHTLAQSPFPDDTHLIGFRGAEGLSRLYQFDVYVSLANDASHDFDLASAVGSKATLKIDRPGGPPYLVHGVFASVELLFEMAGRAVLRAILVPRLWQLTLSRHSRLFTNLSVPDVIKKVLQQGGLSGSDFDLRLQGSYNPEEHICQYEESDFDFVSRWMEREGIYYFFEQGDDDAKLVLCDDKSAHVELGDGKVRYRPTAGEDTSSRESFSAFTCKHNTLPAKVKLSDYDYMKPTLAVAGSAPIIPASSGEIDDHHARFFTPADGDRLSELRAQSYLATEVLYSGRGMVFCLRPGYLFELEEHPRAALNAKYLATEVTHYANQAATTADMARLTGLELRETYRSEVVAIAASVQYRPATRTPRPRIYGTEIAVVDGPADSDYAQIDSAGRYEVKLNFDESDLSGGKASTWIRMLQPHAGNPEGFHFPLRKGTEVLVIFLGGDPDRPVIAGAVPNTQNPSPVTQANHTQNVINTGGNTRIEIEDEDGSQYIDISTPPQTTFLHMGKPHGKHTHYIVGSTGGDCLFNIGSNQDIEVGGKLTEHVKGAVKESYDTSQDTTVTGPLTEHVTGAVTENYDATETIHVKGAVTETYDTGQSTTVTGRVFEQYTGSHDKVVTGPTSQIYAGTRSTLITDNSFQTYMAEVTQKFTGPTTQTFTNPVTQTFGATKTTINGNWVQHITGILDQTIDGPAKIFKTDAHVSVTLGATSDTFIGLKHSGQLAVTLTTSASADISFTASVKLAFNAALDLRATDITVNKASLWSVFASTAIGLQAPMYVIMAGEVVIV